MNLLFAVLLYFWAASPIQSDTLNTNVQEYLDAAYDAGQFSGTVLIRKGDTVFDHSVGYSNIQNQIPNTSNTRFRLGSITKPFTSVLIFQLQEEGLLHIDDPITNWFPDFHQADGVTVRHLLSHRSGIPSFTSFPDYAETMHLPTNSEEIIERFKNLPLEFEPDSQFSYNNSGYILLSVIIEKETGLAYEDALDEWLLKPHGIKGAGYERPDAEIEHMAEGYVMVDGPVSADFIHMSIPMGAGGMYGDVGSLLDFVDKIEDGSILTEASIKEMMEPESGNYGLGWGLGPFLDKPSFGHAGGINGFATNLIHVREDNLTIVVLSNYQTAQIGPIMRDLGSIVYGRQYNIPAKRAEMHITAQQAITYTGTYRLSPDFFIEITSEGNRVFAQATGQPRFEIFPESEHRFFLKVVDAEILFNVVGDGKSIGLTLFQGGMEIPGHRVEN